MLRLMAPKGERLLGSRDLIATFGSSECNVLVSLANMGLPTGFITLLPDNEITHSFKKELRSFEVDTNFVINKEGRFGVYYIEQGSNMRGTKVIYDRDYSSVSLGKPGDIDWEKAFEDTCWYHISGITPALSESLCDLAFESVLCADKMNIPISFDLNYRGKLWKWGKSPCDIIPKFTEKASVIIGTEEDFNTCLGVEGKSPNEILSKAKEICPKAETLSIINVQSKSANYKIWKGEMLFKGNYYESEEYTIYNITDGIGGGDAFSAGLIYAQNNFDEGESIINFATCAGLMKYTFVGDYNLATVEDILNVMKGNKGSINR